MNLIVNADDLGCSEGHNKAIIQSLREGFCSSATIMVNMPGFNDAVERVKTGGYTGILGIHINLTDGPALSEPIRKQRRFCDDDGNFISKRRHHYFILNSKERAAVVEEIVAQIHLCRESGIEPTHADSHNHIHEEPGLISAFIDAVKGAGIPFLRIARNSGYQRSWLIFCYRCLANRCIQSAGLRGTEAFGSADDFSIMIERQKNHASFEIMLHPELYDGIMRDAVSNKPLSEIAEPWKNMRLISYADLKNSKRMRD